MQRFRLNLSLKRLGKRRSPSSKQGSRGTLPNESAINKIHTCRICFGESVGSDNEHSGPKIVSESSDLCLDF